LKGVWWCDPACGSREVYSGERSLREKIGLIYKPFEGVSSKEEKGGEKVYDSKRGAGSSSHRGGGRETRLFLFGGGRRERAVRRKRARSLVVHLYQKEREGGLRYPFVFVEGKKERVCGEEGEPPTGYLFPHGSETLRKGKEKEGRSPGFCQH